MATGNNRPSQRQGQGLQRRALLDQRKKDIMMATLLQNQQAFNAMADVLTADQFGEHDQAFKVVWTLAHDFHAQHGSLADFELLSSEVEDAYNANPNLLTEDELTQLSDFLEWAFKPANFREDLTTSATYADYATRVAKAYMHETLASKVREQVLHKNQIVVNMPEIMQTFQQAAEKIEAVSAEPVRMFAPPGWEKKSNLKLFSTGVPFIDSFLGGGHAAREVYGLMGPFGSCKTTLVGMLAVHGVWSFNKLCGQADWDGVKPLVFMVTYEADEEEMRNRCIGYAAKVLRRTMETLQDMETDLSHQGHLLDYEKKLFRNDIRNLGEAAIPGEYERVLRELPMLNEHLVHLDMTGYNRKGVGNGYIPEIAQRIGYELRQRPGTRCGLVLADYVGAMVKRHMSANDIDLNHLRHLIGGAPILAKSKIATPFNCPTWLVHQLSGDANSMNPAVLPDYTQAAECRSFAENLDFCFTTGVPEKKDSVALFGCPKHRRQPPHDTKIIKIDGALNRVISVDNKYTIDAAQRKIVRLEEYSRVQGRPPARPPAGGTATGTATDLLS